MGGLSHGNMMTITGLQIGPVLGLECRLSLSYNPSKAAVSGCRGSQVKEMFQAAAHPVIPAACLHQLPRQPHPSSLESLMNKTALVLSIS